MAGSMSTITTFPLLFHFTTTTVYNSSLVLPPSPTLFISQERDGVKNGRREGEPNYRRRKFKSKRGGGGFCEKDTPLFDCLIDWCFLPHSLLHFQAWSRSAGRSVGGKEGGLFTFYSGAKEEGRRGGLFCHARTHARTYSETCVTISVDQPTNQPHFLFLSSWGIYLSWWGGEGGRESSKSHMMIMMHRLLRCLLSWSLWPAPI